MNDIEKIIKQIKPVKTALIAKAQQKLDLLTKPKESLGKLEQFAAKVAGITGESGPSLKNKVIFTMAADHGVAEEAVSLFPKEVTAQMVLNFLRGGAGVNVLARHIGAKVIVVDMGVAVDIKIRNRNLIKQKIGFGTANMAKGPAMNREQAIRSVEAGINVFRMVNDKTPINIVGLGEMGIANTTAASAIVSCITGANVSTVTGRGTGIGDAQLQQKINVIKRALRINRPDAQDPLDVLTKVGGFEIGGLAGVILAAAAARIPVVVDGFITASAALIAAGIAPQAKEYMFASHNSVEKGHRIALSWMGLEPMFDLKLRLGEGTGACLGISMIDAGVKIMTEMATFAEAGVSKEK